ncbi:MAG: hypothetical protein WAR57_13835 [Candidatus Phosphoribacter sp.]|nr:hypothetical protein [Actinomycetales bacterium]
MPTRPPRALFEALIDDAAVFPPGLAPLSRAIADHLARRAYRRYVGPLLVPASAAADVLQLADGAALRVALIARPGMPVGPVRDGVALLAESGAGTLIEVAGVEVGAAADWQSLLDLHVPVTVEIPRDGFVGALDAVAEAVRTTARNPLVQAKFRTGATEVWGWPDEDELARFLLACAERDMPFKLTGGLHHAVRGDHPGPDGGPQHGLLNVLGALRLALHGAPARAVTEVLALRDAAALAGSVAGLSTAEVGRLRWAFTAYGCCDVLDPLRELAALHLIDEE